MSLKKKINIFLYYIKLSLFIFPKLNFELQKDIVNDINIYTDDLVNLFKDKKTFNSKSKKREILLDTITDLLKCIMEDKIIEEIKNNENIYTHFKNEEESLKNTFLIDTIENNNENTNKTPIQTQNPKEDLNTKYLDEINKKIESMNKYTENNINNLSNYITDIQNKFNDNIDIQNKLQLLNSNINGEFKQKILDSMTELLRVQLENKMKLISKVIEENILKIVKLYDNRTIEIEKHVRNIIEERLVNIISNFNYKIECNANNELSLINSQTGVITSCKLGIKNIIGPKGPQGDKGETPKLEKILITPEKKLAVLVNDGVHKYSVISDNPLPIGPKGEKGEQGDKGDIGPPGRSIIDLKWDQDNVMHIDYDNNKNLLINRSLSIGVNSHCLHNNSLSIGGAYCIKPYSMAIGRDSKVMGTNSIGLFGSCTNDNSIAMFGNNVENNSILMGNSKELNLDKITLNAKTIDLNCNNFKLKCEKMDNKSIENIHLELETLKNRIITLEKRCL
jgi:hypothetical protein